jgi:FkbM family methyltransferase
MAALKANVRELLRRLGAHPRLIGLTALLLRAATVRPAVVFVAREGLGRRGLFTYRLRQNGLQIAIRHGTGDVVTLGEVFHEQHYRPTCQVEQAIEPVTKIFDLGANIGLFGAFAVDRWPGAEIIAYEPDPANAAIHERTIALNGLQDRWRLTRAAAGARDGRASFVADAVALSHLAGVDDDAGGIEVRVEDVVPGLARADLLKMDIEGGEWTIIADPRFSESPPRALVLEYHPRFCPAPDPRAAAESALRRAGLNVETVWHRGDGHGMLWAWQS